MPSRGLRARIIVFPTKSEWTELLTGIVLRDVPWKGGICLSDQDGRCYFGHDNWRIEHEAWAEAAAPSLFRWCASPAPALCGIESSRSGFNI